MHNHDMEMTVLEGTYLDRHGLQTRIRTWTVPLKKELAIRRISPTGCITTARRTNGAVLEIVGIEIGAADLRRLAPTADS